MTEEELEEREMFAEAMNKINHMAFMAQNMSKCQLIEEINKIGLATLDRELLQLTYMSIQMVKLQAEQNLKIAIQESQKLGAFHPQSN